MDSTIPADLLELKTRLDVWRANRQHNREQIPEQLRQAAVEMTRQYSPGLVRRVLKLDPWRLNRSAAKQTARKKPQATFFKLPSEIALPETGSSAPQTATGSRLLLERPDGARLTLSLPALDLVSINRLCTDFLRS